MIAVVPGRMAVESSPRGQAITPGHNPAVRPMIVFVAGNMAAARMERSAER